MPSAVDNHLLEHVRSLPTRRRSLPAGLVNLKSCELNHPRADELVAGLLRTVPSTAATTYPLIDAATASVADFFGCEEDALVLGAGSDTMLQTIVASLATRTGRAIVHSPAYDAWTHYLALHQVRTTRVPIDLGPGSSLTDELDLVLPHHPPSVVVVTNPHSPTGRSIPFHAIYATCARAADAGHVVVIDECYAWFAGIDHGSLLHDFDNVVVVRTFSKGLGLAGARIACVRAEPSLAAYLNRWRSDGPVSGIALHLLVGALAHLPEWESIWADVACWRDDFTATVLAANPAWAAHGSVANFVTFDAGSAEAAADAVSALSDAGYLTRDLSDLDPLAGNLRVGVAPPAVLMGALEALTGVRV